MISYGSAESVTEIVRFYDFKLNKAEAAAFDVVKGLDGCVRSYHGLEVKVLVGTGSNGVWVQDWLSLAHHTAFQNSAIYPSFTASVAAFASTELDILHAQFQPYPAERAFTAPLTEMTVAMLNSTTTSEDFEAVIQGALLDTPRLDRLSYGVTMEDAKQYIIVNGWESIEAYQEASLSPHFFESLRKIAELDTRLCKLTT